MAALNAAMKADRDAERSKYLRMWRNADYRRFSPGETLLTEARAALAMQLGASVIDFGCGTGRAAAALAREGHPVLAIDFAGNCLDANVRIPFLEADLSDLPMLRAEYGLCCDVMEHVPEHQVDDVLRGIARSVGRAAFFSIALAPDAFGAVIGETLHVTLRDAAWWRARLSNFWPDVTIKERGPTLIATCRKVSDHEIEAPCNTPQDVIVAQVRLNSARDLPWLNAIDAHDGHAVMVGGGPSLSGELDGIRARVAHGQTVFALNDAANFLVRHGIIPDYQLVIDARAENARFVKPRPARKYLLASQCHAALFDELAGADVTLFHWGMEGIVELLRPLGRRFTILAGSYVLGPIALSAATALGFRNLHLYGYDSSDAADGSAHAYEQAETAQEAKRLYPMIGGRRFRCSFAMYKQAMEFPAFAQMLADNGCTLTVHGDGLLPTVAREMISPTTGE